MLVRSAGSSDGPAFRRATLVRAALAAGSVQVAPSFKAAAPRFPETLVKDFKTLAKCILYCLLVFSPWDFKKASMKPGGGRPVMPRDAL